MASAVKDRESVLGHEIAHEAEVDLRRRYGQSSDVMVHVEPPPY
jgi:divalent metal cation (Fe/Co/Zn/Cd) transporter